jgi:CPA1 family monovalent cation:H+ antiporter
MFAVEAVGGVALGLALGYVAYRLLRSVDDYQVEVLITVALVTGGYALAGALHTSGPLAMVAAGLLIGNHGRRLAMSERTRRHIDTFWELVDEIINAVLFVLIGTEVLVLTFSGRILLAGALAVPMVLLARLTTVGAGVHLVRRWARFAPRAVYVLTWGGLRGGISVALALSLPDGSPEQRAARTTLLTITYVVVAFSIIVQGLTIGRLVRGAKAARPADHA